MNSCLPFALILAVLAISSSAEALCPRKLKNKLNLPDIVCDRELHVVISGDSIVRGVGDTDNSGGYVLRLQKVLPKAVIRNLGVPGTTTDELRRAFIKNLTKKGVGETKMSLDRVDLLILDVGRNDYFQQRRPALTVQNLYRLVRFLRAELKRINGVAPYIAVSTLIPTLRPQQKPFVDEVNRLLLRRNSASFPVLVRFSEIAVGPVLTPTPISSGTPAAQQGRSRRMIRAGATPTAIPTPTPTVTPTPRYIDPVLTVDGLHPNSHGYDLMAAKLVKALKGPIQTQMKGYTGRLGLLPEVKFPVDGPTPTPDPFATPTPNPFETLIPFETPPPMETPIANSGLP